MIIVTYKLMINILVPKDFIRYENNNFENNINQKKFSTIESAMQNLTEYYFDNINTLYPLFLGENKDNIYNHLIPIEEKHLSISVSQVFDSYVFDNKNEIKLCVLAEVGKEKNKIFIFNIKNKEKLNDIGKDSIIIEEIEDKEEIDIKKNFESIEQNLNLSEVKIFKDLNYIYLFNKKGYLSIDNQEKIKPVKFEKEIPSFQQIIPQFNSKEEIYKFEIYDECNIIDKIINNSQDKNEEIKIQQEPKNTDIEKLDINALSEREIILLSKMFDFQRANINLSNNPSNVKGIIKSQTENPNEYNKIYFNNTSKKKTLYLSNNQFILLSNIDILLNPKIKLENKINDKTQIKQTLNPVENTALSMESFNKINDFIPLTIVDFKGAQSQNTINISSILFNDHRFVSNYPKPDYLFSHLQNNPMIIDNIVVSSDESPKSSDLPFGKGCVFLINSLESIPIAKRKYSNCKLSDFKKLYQSKVDNNEDFYDYDPVCFIDMGNNLMVKSNVVKKKTCNYIYFLPTNGRDDNINKFETQLMSLLFFGVEGKVLDEESISVDDKKNYIKNTLGENKLLNNISVNVNGYLKNDINNVYNIAKIDEIEINSIIHNNDINSHFYFSKNSINNDKFKNKKIDTIDVEIVSNNDNFDIIGVSCSFISFKDLDKNLLMTNDDLINNSILINNNFHNLILDTENFNKFNLFLSSYIYNNQIDISKRIAILQYLKYLFNKLPGINNEILLKIDYYNLIKNNIIENNNNILSSLSFNFLRTAVENPKANNIIESSLDKILSDISSLQYTCDGLNHLFSIIKIYNVEKGKFTQRAINIIKKCIKIIKEQNFETNEQIFINSHLLKDEYPFDFYKFNDNSNSDSQSEENENKEDLKNSLSYLSVVMFNNDLMNILIDMGSVNSINKIKLDFSQNDSTILNNLNTYNFRVNIFSINEKCYEIKLFKYYYDHVWRQLTKNVSSSSQNKNNDDKKNTFSMFGNYNFRSLIYNFEKDEIDFTTRYICINISINDSTNDIKTFPSLKIVPIIYGQVSSNQVYLCKTINEIFVSNHLKYDKKDIFNGEYKKIKGFIKDTKKYTIIFQGQNNHDIIKKDNKDNIGTLKAKYAIDLNENGECIKINIKNIVNKLVQDIQKHKEQTIVEISRANKIQRDINKLNLPVNLNESLSLNLQIIKFMLNEINILNDENLIVDNNFIENLIIVSLFNESANEELNKEVYTFTKKKFFLPENKTNVNNLFSRLVELYLNKENVYMNALTLINIFNQLNIDNELFLKEFQKCFSDEEYNKWTKENFKNIFYKISILTVILITKIKNSIELPISIEEYIKIFIDITKKLIDNDEQLKISSDMSCLLLAQILNLTHEYVKSQRENNLKKISTNEFVKFLIEILNKLWEKEIIKDKLSKIIDLVIDPYDLLNDKIKKEEKVKIPIKNFDKTILTIQEKTLEFIQQINNSILNEEEEEKFDYILNLLNNCYSINSLNSEISSESEVIIKKNNNEIIENFISIAVKFNKTSKIGFSNVNSFWKYLTDILERGNLDMMFYNNNFKKLMVDSFLKLDYGIQELLYTKFTNVFLTLYKQESHTLKQNMFYQIMQVFVAIIKSCANEKNEMCLLDFIHILTEILLYGNYATIHKQSDLLLTSINLDIEKNKEHLSIVKELYIEIGKFLLLHLNYSAFGGAVSGNQILYKRIIAIENLLIIINSFSLQLFNNLPKEEIEEEEFKKSLRNYLIYLIFNIHKEKTTCSPVIRSVIKCWNYVENIVDNYAQRKELIEICLVEIMKIVRKIDENVINGIKNEKMSLKYGIRTIDKTFKTLKNLLGKFLIDDTITKYFAFELQGFKFFIDRIISHRKEKINSDNKKQNESENEIMANDLNEDLLKSLNDLYDTQDKKEDDKNQLNSNILKESGKMGKPYKPLFFPLNKNKDDKKQNDKLNTDLSKFKLEEFASPNKIDLLEGDPKFKLSAISNYNWSNKKIPSTGQIYSRELKKENFYEDTFIFRLTDIIEVKEILITFNHYNSLSTDKIFGDVPTVYLEVGKSLNKFDTCIKLDKISDAAYFEKGITAFGFNFFSNRPDMLKDDDNYIDNFIEQLIKCQGKYFKFIVRRPIMLSTKNSHSQKIDNGICSIPINCVSIIGEKLIDNYKVLEYIQEKEKNISITIISKIFTTEFINTLKHIAKDKAFIENIKQIYNSFEPYISKHANILSRILINVSKYNFELGEWLLNRLLNVENSEIHAKLAVEITQNSQEYVDERINKFINFILKEVKKSYNEGNEKKLLNISNFMKYFCLSLNGLLLSPFHNEIKLNFNFEDLRDIIYNINKYTIIKKEILSFVSILLIPNKKLKLNEDSIDTSQLCQPKNSLKILNELFEKNYIYDYLEIISYLVCNNKEYEKIFIEGNSAKYYCEMFINEVTNGIRGKNMLYLMNMLKNMSFSENFVKLVRENDYDFKIFDCIKNKKEKSDTILINNNLDFMNNVVIFMKNCISNYPECHKKLAEILIKDLELFRQKNDKNYVNHVLIPLLKIERTTNICIHPIDSNVKNIYSSYCNLESNDNASSEETTDSNNNSKDKKQMDSLFKEPKLVSSYFYNEDSSKKNIQEEKLKSILIDSSLNIEIQNLFSNLFTSFEYEPGKKFKKYNFKKIFSSKDLDSKKIKEQLISTVCNQGPFLIIMYPLSMDSLFLDKKPMTFFFYNGLFPNLPSNQSNLDDINFIPLENNENLLCQICNKKYITASLKPESSGNHYELGSLNIESDCYYLTVSDLINLNLTENDSSTINPFIENIPLGKSNEMDNFLDTDIKFYEVYIGTVIADDKKKQGGISSNISKIIPIKYINETGNLNLNIVKQNKYFNINHPIATVRDNPIFEFPSNIPFKRIKDMIVSDQIPFNNLLNNEEIPNEVIIENIPKYSDSNNITDIYYEVSSLRDLKLNTNEIESKDEREIKIDYELMDYAPDLPIFKEFEKLEGIKNIISVLKSTVQKWTNKEAIDFWIKWTDDLEIFCQLPSFFASLISHQQCSSILFNLLCGFYDNENSIKKEGTDVSKYIFEILGNSFSKNRSGELRKIAIEKGIFNCIIERLELLTHEKPRKYSPGEEKEEEKKKSEDTNDKKDNPNLFVLTGKKKLKRGVGYGSDQTGDNKTWDVTQYLAGKKNNSLQIASIIKLLTDFFDTSDMQIDDKTLRVFLESSILPCLESAYRGGTLLELAKEAQLYYAYLDMTIKLSKNPSLIPLLLDISKDYKPVQTQSVYTLLSLLNDGTKIFANALKHESAETGKTKSTEEQLSNEIMRTFDIVTKHIKSYQIHLDNKKNYTEILKLPVEKSYPLLLREFAFDYMSMKNKSGKLEHYYSNSVSGNPSSGKAIRLAQEFADLPRSLPIESTNSIYVRVDKDNMDYMKVLIMGSEGTPYSNGAFQFDVFFDGQYPNAPPKVTIMTTGGGTTRFNPNLYSNGKVCLSLLGTWRGQSTENWDPKISTLLQVLISIQGIIMSDLVYFNEPSCESEMGTPQGEAKNEAYSNIVRYSNIKYAMIEQIRKPSPGFEEVIQRHFYLKREQILKEVKGWIERSKVAEAKYSSFSLEHNSNLATKMSKPGAYTQMMNEIYVELEKTLNSLPLPSDLQKKAEDEKIEKEKKSEKITFENIDNVDMTYDKDNINKKIENKELNLNDDEVKDRWSRYIGAMGIEAVQRQANSSIFLSGAGGLGIEIAKNLVLSGCKLFVLHDNKNTNFYDLSSQFFLSENDIGKNRAECSVKKLQELNYYVKVQSSNVELSCDENKINDILKNFDVIILTECDNDILISIDNYCRKNNKKFISCDIFGSVGRLINDFGNEFIVNDKDGEEAKEVMVKNIEIINDNEALITVLDGTRHDFVDDDIVEVNEVVGLDGINKKQFKVKVLTPGTFNLIGDFKIFKDKKYERNGICREIKQKKIIKFDPIENIINVNSSNYQSICEKYTDPNMLISDFSKMKNGPLINLSISTINTLKKTYKEKIEPWSLKFSSLFINTIKTKESQFSEEDLKILYYISFTHMVQFPCLCAYFGGFASQEAIKSITNKYTPIKQIMFQDILEFIPEININNEKSIETSIKNFNYKERKTRTDTLQIILGEETVEKILNMKILIVGAGAIGCELLKNFSMLSLGTGKNGSIYVTDPDIIEVSNLNRQFLFREKHLRLPKSSTAAAAVIQMNPLLKNHIFAKIEKLCEETENIFSDNFISSLSLIANALDNINARRYVDSRCVSNRKPLLESGTLGPKGHVQIIIPFKTESYSSQNDPEVSNDIPQCTLKMFPEEAIHCVEWARDQFGKIFTQLPKSFNKVIDEFKNGNYSNDEIKLVKKTIKWIKKKPNNFNDCLIIAREKFNKVFVNNIKQLLYAYPIDKKDKNGKLFWSLPKRPPVIDEFNVDDQLCVDFISAYSCLIANMFGIKIPYDKPRDNKNKIDMCSKIKNVKVEDFKPNEEKLKEIEKEVEESEGKKTEEEKKEENKNDNNEISTSDKDELMIKELKEIISQKGFNMKLNPTEFEKDNDLNFHIDIIYAMSALRCRNYKLEIMDWMTVKIKAGRIIPALATTTSSIAALQSIELVKIAKNIKFENYRNSFLNLAIPYLQSSEPGICKKNVIHNNLSTTLWDRWEINLEKDKCNIKSLFDILKNKYMLFPRDIFKGKKAIYSYMAYKDKGNLNEEILNKNLIELIGVKEDNYVDLMVTFTLNEKDDTYLKDIPIVRVHFQK